MSVPVLRAREVYKSQEFRWRTPVVDGLLCEDGTLWSLHEDHSIVRWELPSGRVLQVIETLAKGFRAALLLTEQRILAWHFSGEISLWNVSMNTAMARTKSPLFRSSFPVKTRDGSVVVGPEVVLFVARAAFEERAFRGRLLALSDDGNWLVSQEERAVQLWNVRDGTLTAQREVEHHIHDAVWSCDGSLLYLIESGVLQCWEVQHEAGTCRFASVRWSAEKTDPMDSCFLLEEREELYSYCAEEFRYDVRSARDGTILRTFGSQRRLLVSSSDGHTAVFGDGAPFLRGDLVAGTVEDVRDAECGEILSIDVSSSGRYVLWTNENGAVVAESNRGEVLAVLPTVRSRAIFLPEETTIASASGLECWSDGHERVRFALEEQSSARCERIVCSDDGSWILLLYRHGRCSMELVLCSVNDGAVVWKVQWEGLHCSADFSDDGASVLVLRENSFERRSLATGEVLEVCEIRDGELRVLHRSLGVCGARDWSTEEFLLVAQRAGERTPMWKSSVLLAPTEHFFTAFCAGEWLVLWVYFSHRAVVLHAGTVVAELRFERDEKLNDAVISLPLRALFVATGRGNIYRYELPEGAREEEPGR